MNWKNKVIKSILWVEFIGVSWVPFYVAISGMILLFCYEQFITYQNITGFGETYFIPCVLALSVVIILPAIFRWRTNEIKHIEEDFKRLKEKKNGTL